jgi:hypothetical protein
MPRFLVATAYRSELSGDLVPLPAGPQLGQTDQHVEAEVFLEQGFEVAAFDDLDGLAGFLGSVGRLRGRY